ncbi:MAG TPA: hypothetical protein VGQ96_02295 [Candidatus Eremiobacteraceae bacterium]|nr:hypothetical protein [Candidatus Eremiobacteraceae bacterium]
MKTGRTIVIASAVFAALMLTTLLRAYGFGFPGIPGLPGLSPQDLAIKAAAKQMAPFVAAKAPIILDWKAVFATTPTLPGKPFAPIADATQQSKVRTTILSQLAHSTTGVVNLSPGDYALQMRVYCTDVHRHAGHQALWLMGPLHGARANVLEAMYARASGKNLNFTQLQMLSWALQAGMRYDELNPALRQLADQLIPDLRSQIAGSFLDQVQGQWNTLSSTIPNLPSLDEALGRMGETGQTVLNIKYARESILANASDFAAMSRSLAPPGGSAEDSNVGEPPWSIVTDRVYERIITAGNFGSTSTVQIRVTGAGTTTVPLTSVISYPPNHHDWQPLTQESPTLAFGSASAP